MNGRSFSPSSLRGRLSKVPILKRVWRELFVRWVAFSMSKDYFQDYRRYARHWHGVGFDKHAGQHERAILKAYHGVEKGLSLTEPRPGFGQSKIRNLMRLIDNHPRSIADSDAATNALAAIRAYREFNLTHGIVLDWLDKWLEEKPQRFGQGGIRHISRQEIAEGISIGGADFFATRHSIRQFGADPVPMADIRRAVMIAQKTPSACNRQGFRAYCFKDPRRPLSWQPGNTGFGHLASRALVVTADLQAFSGPGERNQAWIDGGMFSMSILYALHALGFGACPLAWSQRAGIDRRAKADLLIPDNEVIIMMIAVGTLPDRFQVAFSQRLKPEGVFIQRDE